MWNTEAISPAPVPQNQFLGPPALATSSLGISPTPSMPGTHLALTSRTPTPRTSTSTASPPSPLTPAQPISLFQLPPISQSLNRLCSCHLLRCSSLFASANPAKPRAFDSLVRLFSNSKESRP